jgi:hypothetical protein
MWLRSLEDHLGHKKVNALETSLTAQGNTCHHDRFKYYHCYKDRTLLNFIELLELLQIKFVICDFERLGFIINSSE